MPAKFSEGWRESMINRISRQEAEPTIQKTDMHLDFLLPFSPLWLSHYVKPTINKRDRVSEKRSVHSFWKEKPAAATVLASLSLDKRVKSGPWLDLKVSEGLRWWMIMWGARAILKGVGRDGADKPPGAMLQPPPCTCKRDVESQQGVAFALSLRQR